MGENRIWGLILAVDIMRWQPKEPVECRKVLNSKELSKRPMQSLKPYVDSSKGLNLKLRWKHLLLQLLCSCLEMCSWGGGRVFGAHGCSANI